MSDRHNWKFQYIAPAQLKVDPSYQRQVDDKRIKKIINGWNYDLVRPPMVSQRADNTYWIIDGQHTTVAWNIHENGAHIMCRVCNNLTHDEEVELFLQQFGFSDRLDMWERSRAQYNRGDQDIVIMVESVKAAGIEVSFNSVRGRNKTAAIKACLDGVKRLGAWRFTNALSILRDAWDGDQNTMGMYFISGIVELYAVNEGQFDRARLVSVLGKKSPNYYVRAASEHHGNVGKRYAAAFRDEYNRVAKKNKLSAE